MLREKQQESEELTQRRARQAGQLGRELAGADGPAYKDGVLRTCARPPLLRTEIDLPLSRPALSECPLT